MRPLLFKAIALTLLLVTTVVMKAQPLEKKFEKRFTVDCTTNLNVSHQFGTLKIIPTKGQEIEIKAVAKIEAKNAKKAQIILDGIDIKMTQSGKNVTIKTSLNESNNDVKEMDISMEISVPECITANIKHRFGNLILPNYSGELDIDLEFGALSAGIIKNKNNKISLKFSKPSQIDETGEVELKMRFSELTITEATKVALNSQYSTIEIETNPAMIGKSQFDKIEIGRVAVIDLNSRYTELKIKELNGIGRFDLKFGSLNIDMVKEGFKELDFTADYTNIKIGLEKHTGFSFDANASFTSIRVPFPVKSTKSVNNEHATANFGNEATIKAKLKFGDFRIKK
ncbi:MAG: hypothetical protein PHU27_13055 [Salinivirgaceae bacterium]|nr:hypothetical protein [Salinivirgaceae bacterium]MDD4747993.1 hypothetical protein [Salinivirgaceae bacterium]MDY0282618.1 hypothetical protein [Salinivirgaceae bacterium]